MTTHGLESALQAATGFLAQMGLSFKIIAKPYRPALQDIQMMLTLDHANIPAMDWIIVADTDELYTFGYPSLAEATAKMEAEGATYALGEMLDHVAANGTLAHLQASPSPCCIVNVTSLPSSSNHHRFAILCKKAASACTQAFPALPFRNHMSC